MIERLDNNEHILLMYLAGELPAEDHAEVEQLLATDLSMQRELEQLRTADVAMTGMLGRLDELSPLPISADFAARQVGRAMRQHLAKPQPRRIERSIEQPGRRWRWLYPTAVAASVAILAMVWLSREASTINSPYAYVPKAPQPQQPEVTPGLPSMSETTHRPWMEGAPVADSDDVLLLKTLQRQADGLDSGESKPVVDADPKQVALGDGIPQDELSQYLLSVGAGGK